MTKVEIITRVTTEQLQNKVNEFLSSAVMCELINIKFTEVSDQEGNSTMTAYIIYEESRVQEELEELEEAEIEETEG